MVYTYQTHMTETKPPEISGTIKNITFRNRETGYMVLKLDRGTTLCGIYHDTTASLEGARIKASGEWKKHKTYGLQFVFRDLTARRGALSTRVRDGREDEAARGVLEREPGYQSCILDLAPRKGGKRLQRKNQEQKSGANNYRAAGRRVLPIPISPKTIQTAMRRSICRMILLQ